jgi:hypothetical protein
LKELQNNLSKEVFSHGLTETKFVGLANLSCSTSNIRNIMTRTFLAVNPLSWATAKLFPAVGDLKQFLLTTF